MIIPLLSVFYSLNMTYAQEQAADNSFRTGGLASVGQGTGNTTAIADKVTPAQQKSITTTQGDLINTATASLVGNSISNGSGQQMSIEEAKKLLCNGGVEGSGGQSMKQIKMQKMQECIQQQMQQKKKIQQAIQAKQAQKENCTVKVSKQSMICHTKRVIQDMVTRPVWEIKTYGNIVFVYKDGEAVMAVVSETLNYDVTRKTSAKKDALKEPNVDIKFNELGGLLSQKGELPTSKMDDPCAICIQSLNKKANTMEGGLDDCNYSCDSLMLRDFIKPGHFREIQQQKGEEEKGDTGDKPPAGDQPAEAA